MSKTIQADNDPSVWFIVDDEDYADLCRYRWVMLDGYAKANHGHRQRMHRYIMSKRRCLDGLVIDHADGNRTDNRKANLRVATRSENRANTGKYRNNQSGYKGVRKYGQYWYAEIKKDGQYEWIGSFATPQAAAFAYDQRAIFLYGEFALLNRPDISPAVAKTVLDYLKYPHRIRKIWLLWSRCAR